MECGPALPDSLVLEIFLHLPHDAVLSAGLACRQWLAVSRDEFLWRELFYSYYRIPRSVPRHPGVMMLISHYKQPEKILAYGDITSDMEWNFFVSQILLKIILPSVSWYREFKRLYDCIACEEVQTLTGHHDQVLHLAFSHRGHRFSSCSKDCTIKLWDTERPDGIISLVHSSSMLHFNWAYTQFSQFNADDTLLLVSGLYLGPHQVPTISGEIAVISLDNYTLLSRVWNRPYDVFGCWLNESHLISGNRHWIGNITSCSVFWLNKAFQDIESENVNVVKRLFQIQNVNASRVRTVMVAHSRRHDNPDLLLDYEAQSLARAQTRARTQRGGPHQTLHFDLGGTDSEEDGSGDEGEDEDEQRLRSQGLPAVRLPQPTSSGLEVLQRCRGAGSAELEAEATVAMMGRAYTKTPDPSLITASAPGDGEDKTYLLFTTGSLTYSPHQIGIKRIMPDQMSTCGPVLGEERSSEEFFDSLDHVIDIHGHIIGMGLSPDHRYLYVNSRAWPAGCVISDPMSPPPIAEEIDLHVIDLKNLREEKMILRSHKAYTPNAEFFFIFLDVSRDFVASGAEDKHGYIWDRHYNICLARLAHQDVVNCVAFSPADQELLLSASNDSTIKVWRSPRMVRLARSHTPRRNPLPAWFRRYRTPTTTRSTTAAAATTTTTTTTTTTNTTPAVEEEEEERRETGEGETLAR